MNAILNRANSKAASRRLNKNASSSTLDRVLEYAVDYSIRGQSRNMSPGLLRNMSPAHLLSNNASNSNLSVNRSKISRERVGSVSSSTFAEGPTKSPLKLKAPNLEHSVPHRFEY